MRPRLPVSLLPLACALAWTLAAAPAAATGNEARAVQARLSGYEEVPAVSSAGNGTFKAFIDKATGEIDYEFSYAGMQGTVTQAHIHFGQRGVNGGIAVWLCQSGTNPAPAAVAATTPVCASPAAVFTGRITANSVLGPGGTQQLAAGELAEFAAALRAGVAYVNVHTNLSPGGEVRGQIRPGHHHHHHHH
ncbi:MAG: CHRD domain-containing protein [Rubrivivax sp.]|nr:CHRD domain-containing protein [Rubrivivax sp.]